MARFEDYIQSNETPKDLCREIDELQKKYNELNDFSNSQCKKLLEENEKLKWENKQILEDNDYYQKENKELEKAITEKNSVIEKMKNDVRNEITRHSLKRCRYCGCIQQWNYPRS